MKLPTNYSALDWRKGEKRLARERYVEIQENKCYWCQHDLDGPPSKEVSNKEINWKLFPEGFQNHPVHLQHNHETGMTEGAVHMKCNAYMWQYHNR